MPKKIIHKFMRFIEPSARAYATHISNSPLDEFLYNLYMMVPWHWYRGD